jgi:hypothetical protein
MSFDSTIVPFILTTSHADEIKDTVYMSYTILDQHLNFVSISIYKEAKKTGRLDPTWHLHCIFYKKNLKNLVLDSRDNNYSYRIMKPNFKKVKIDAFIYRYSEFIDEILATCLPLLGYNCHISDGRIPISKFGRYYTYKLITIFKPVHDPSLESIKRETTNMYLFSMKHQIGNLSEYKITIE